MTGYAIPFVPDRERPELYGEAACIDCLLVTPRRLPESYPHICTGCLFPPLEDGPERDPIKADPRDWSQQVAELHLAVAQQLPPFRRVFGADLNGHVYPKADGDR